MFGVPEQAMVHDSLTTLFTTAPLAGVVLFTMAGTLLAWLQQLIHDYGRDSSK